MKKIYKEWKSSIFLILLIIFVTLFLRLYELTSLPVFADEAIYVRWAQVMRSESTLRFLPLSDGKQPLFMWSVIPFFKVFSDPLFASRFVSVLSGLGTLVGIFLLSYQLTKSKRAALFAGGIYSLSPYSVFFDRIGLVDSMLSMFGIWTLLLGVLTVKSKRLDYAMLTGFALGGALLTKSPAIFFSLMLPTTWLLGKWPKKLGAKAKEFFNLAKLFVPTYIIGYGMYNILRLGPNFHLVGSRNQDYVLPISHLWTNPKDPFIFHIDRVLGWFWDLGPWPFVLLFAFGAFVGFKKWRKEILVLTTWVLLPLLVQSMYAKAFTTRYVLFSLAPAIVVASFVFVSKVKTKAVNLLVALFVIFATWSNYVMLSDVEAAKIPRVMRSGYLEEWTSGTGIREVGQILREEYQAEPEEKIVVGTEGYFGTLPDGLQVYLNDLPEITVIGVGLNIKEIPSSLVESRQSGNKTYLVINSSRLKAEPEEIGLELVAAYPKAFRPEGSEKYIHHGPQETLYLFRLD